MALNSAITSAVKTADKVTKSLQETVYHEAWYGQNGFGKAFFGPPVARKAVVDRRRYSRKMGDGIQVEVRGSFLFLDTIPPDGAAGRDEPIDSRDRLTLVDGLTGPIVEISKMHDPSLARPYLLEVRIGVKSGT